MIYSADFEDLCGRLNHIEVVKYLKDLGWQELPIKKRYVKYFQFYKGSELFQVDVPTEKNIRNYRDAMFQVVQTISNYSGNNFERVLLELLNPMADIVRFHVKNPNIEGGSIGIENGLSLYTKAKMLVESAAKDAINPKLVHKGRTNRKIEQFLSRCKFGQTEIGSYVVSIVCPMLEIKDDDCHQLSLFDSQDEVAYSITRQTTNKLMTSIAKIKLAIDDGNLDSIAQDNISVGFVDSVKSLGIEDSETEITISTKWAPTIKSNIPDVSSVTLTQDYYSPMNAFCNRFRSTKSDMREFIGRVYKISANPKIENRDYIIAMIEYNDEKNHSKKAKFKVLKDNWDIVYKAMMMGTKIKVKGELNLQEILEPEISSVE